MRANRPLPKSITAEGLKKVTKRMDAARDMELKIRKASDAAWNKKTAEHERTWGKREKRAQKAALNARDYRKRYWQALMAKEAKKKEAKKKAAKKKASKKKASKKR